MYWSALWIRKIIFLFLSILKFSLVILVESHPERSSSPTLSPPSRNSLCHSRIIHSSLTIGLLIPDVSLFAYVTKLNIKCDRISLLQKTLHDLLWLVVSSGVHSTSDLLSSIADSRLLIFPGIPNISSPPIVCAQIASRPPICSRKKQPR